MDLVEVIDRERARIAGAEGADFLRRLPDYLDLVKRKRSLRRLAAQMSAEAETRYSQFLADENALMEEAVSLRTELVDRAPEIDDSDLAEPDQATHEYGDYMASLAYFDQLVGQTIPIPIPTLPNDSISQEPVTNLIRILRGRLFTARFGEGQHLL